MMKTITLLKPCALASVLLLQGCITLSSNVLPILLGGTKNVSETAGSISIEQLLASAAGKELKTQEPLPQIKELELNYLKVQTELNRQQKNELQHYVSSTQQPLLIRCAAASYSDRFRAVQQAFERCKQLSISLKALKRASTTRYDHALIANQVIISTVTGESL